MSFEVTGKLHEIFEEQQVSEKFRKREFVLEIDDNSFTQYIKFQATQDRCSMLDSYNKGDMAKVNFNLSGRPFTNREGQQVYFTNLVAWRMEKVGGAHAASPHAGYEVPEFPHPADDSDDLPF